MQNMNPFYMLKDVYLVFGSACNIHCRHCLQGPAANHFCVRENKDISDDVINFLVEWSQFNIVDDNEKFGKHLIMWGGEPLIYFDLIVELVNKLKLAGFNFSVSLNIVTNGVMLNQRHIDFFKLNNFKVILSYDLPNMSNVRNIIPDKRQIELWKQVKRKGVNSVITAGNIDILKCIKMAHSMFPDARVSILWVLVPWNMPEDIYAFKPGEIRKSLSGVLKYYRYHPVDQAFNDFFGEVFSFGTCNTGMDFKSRLLTKGISNCAQGYKQLALHIDGTVSFCCCNDFYIGKITEDYDVLRDRLKEKFLLDLPSGCFECKYLDMCRVRCPNGVKTDDGKEYVHCRYLKEFYGFILENKTEIIRLLENYDSHH